MRVSAAAIIWLVVTIASLRVTAQQQDIPRWRALNQTARAAIDAKDYAKLRQTLLELQPLLPGNPRLAYNLAAAEARLGNQTAALQALRNWAGMGLTVDLASDRDFDSVKESTSFASIAAKVESSRKPVRGSRAFSAIAGDDLIPEDIAFDPKTRRYFISSVRKGLILSPQGTVFAKSEWPVFALRADPVKRILWATTGWVPQCEACSEADKDRTAVLAFDLDTGALKRRIKSPVAGLLGDMTLSPRGDLYISEGLHGAVLHLGPESSALERLDSPGEFPSPQTPALSADEKTLYVPDYIRGIAAIDLASRTVKWLRPANNVALSGIDGLYLHRNSFVAVQNGTSPQRIIRFSADLHKQEVLEANTPELGEPTHGVLAGDDFYFLANSGWGEYDSQGKKKEGSAPVKSSIRVMHLTR